MKKFGRFLLVIIILGALGYGFYMLFVMPKGFVKKEDILTSFISNVGQANVCEEHYNPETYSNCEAIVAGLTGESVAITDLSAFGSEVTMTLTIGDTDEDFTVTFIEEEVTGLSGFFNSKYYYIDIIE